MLDEYSATWVSHSSINDFLKCPRLYYLKYIYKTSDKRHRISLITPHLSLGQIVHDVLEQISNIPLKERFSKSLNERLEDLWLQIEGKRGGFLNDAIELKYKTKAREILNRIQKNLGPLSKLSVKIKMDLPHYWLSEKDNLILCGKIDWLEYIQENDSVGIIDFKTGEIEVDNNSLQLPIYYLLASHCQKRKVEKVSYWYLSKEDEPRQLEVPNIKTAFDEVYKHAKLIKARRQMDSFNCLSGKGGCKWCEPYEKIIKHKAEYVGVSKRKEDIYILNTLNENQESIIL